MGLLFVLFLVTAPNEDGAKIALLRQSRPFKFAVLGLDGKALSTLRERSIGKSEWNRLLAVGIASKGPLVAMLGSYEISDEGIEFTPRFPLQPGLTYRAEFRPNGLAPRLRLPGKAIERAFKIGPRPIEKKTRLVAIYPSSDELPQNQLKFYLHFSRPMSRGQVYRHVHLLDEKGREVKHPFIELHEELWDRTETRFTLFFDPGRVKRGLVPNKELGPPLTKGRRYTLVIAREWEDATGQPLAEAARKPFRVVSADRTQPDPKTWRLGRVDEATRQALSVEFAEPLDHAMLERVILVRDSKGGLVAGDIQIDRNETRWRFTPEQPWRTGRYALDIGTSLEDLAGNSIGRAFEVDLFDHVDRRIDDRSVLLPFEPRRSR